MIPTIEDIVADLIAGTMTKERAVHWLYAQVENEGLRDGFAASALQGLLSDLPKTFYGPNWMKSVVQSSYEIADAMLKERTK